MSKPISDEIITRARQSGFNIRDYSIFLPALNTLYLDAVEKEIPEGRPVPAGFTMDKLKFWSEGGLWQYPVALNTVASYKPLSSVNNAITNTPANLFFTVGDSGGFSIASGAMPIAGLKEAETPAEAMNAWSTATEIKMWMIHFLKTHYAYSHVIDFPLWTLTAKGKDSPFRHCTIEELTSLTVENLEAIQQYGDGGKWINIVQGLDAKTTRDWLDAVSAFKFDAWSVGGGAGYRGGLAQILRTTLTMRDRGLLDSGCDLLHFLGVSQPIFAVIFTRIMQHLRKSNNPDLVVTYDASSPLLIAGQNEQVAILPKFGKNIADWSISAEQSPQEAALVGSIEIYPYENPFGDALQMGHLNVYDDQFNKRRYDNLSLAILSNINIHTYLTAFQRANELVAQNSHDLPDEVKQVLDVIDEAFTTKEDWELVLIRHNNLLNSIKRNEYVNQFGVIQFLQEEEDAE
jgi:hypothetical protein